jgi:hypothetical protein
MREIHFKLSHKFSPTRERQIFLMKTFFLLFAYLRGNRDTFECIFTVFFYFEMSMWSYSGHRRHHLTVESFSKGTFLMHFLRLLYNSLEEWWWWYRGITINIKYYAQRVESRQLKSFIWFENYRFSPFWLPLQPFLFFASHSSFALYSVYAY